MDKDTSQLKLQLVRKLSIIIIISIRFLIQTLFIIIIYQCFHALLGLLSSQFPSSN